MIGRARNLRRPVDNSSIAVPYDEQLANRIRRLLDDRRHFTERKMFGGLAFLYNGRMCCGIVGQDLMVRIPRDTFDAVLRIRYVRPMDFTGTPLKGFVYVSPAGFATAASLRAWVNRGEEAAQEAGARGAPRRTRRTARCSSIVASRVSQPRRR